MNLSLERARPCSAQGPGRGTGDPRLKVLVVGVVVPGLRRDDRDDRHRSLVAALVVAVAAVYVDRCFAHPVTLAPAPRPRASVDLELERIVTRDVR